MKRQRHNAFRCLGSLLAGLAVCLSPAFATADADVQVLGSDQLKGQNTPLVIWPLQKEQSSSGLTFDLGGSETRKLELQLSEPLTLNIRNKLQKSSSGIGSVFLDSSLNLHLNNNLDITTSLGAEKSQASFRS